MLLTIRDINWSRYTQTDDDDNEDQGSNAKCYNRKKIN